MRDEVSLKLLVSGFLESMLAMATLGIATKFCQMIIDLDLPSIDFIDVIIMLLAGLVLLYSGFRNKVVKELKKQFIPKILSENDEKNY